MPCISDVWEYVLVSSVGNDMRLGFCKKLSCQSPFCSLDLWNILWHNYMKQNIDWHLCFQGLWQQLFWRTCVLHRGANHYDRMNLGEDAPLPPRAVRPNTNIHRNLEFITLKNHISLNLLWGILMEPPLYNFSLQLYINTTFIKQ